MKHVWILGGATASGKTTLAIKMAEILQTEIINCDSRQVYKELNIGVAKPSAEELNRVPHHGINISSIEDHFSAGTFQQLLRPTLDLLFEKHNHVIVTGGTGLYIQHLLFNLDELPEVDWKIREKVNQWEAAFGNEFIAQKLLENDPEAGDFVKLDNPARAKRALELVMQLNKPVQEIFSQKISPYNENYQLHFMAIDLPREILYQRINERVDQMVADGLVNEVENLVQKSHIKALQTVGYSELFEYFSGNTTRDEAIDRIKQHTRNYAKRQITYFKHQFPTQWHQPQDILEFVSNFATQ